MALKPLIKTSEIIGTGVEGGLEGIDARDKFRYLNILIHSPSGHGKTSTVASACDDERTSPILVLDCDGGAPLRFVGKDASKYTIIDIKSIDDVSANFNYLNKGSHPYKSVLIDNLGALQKVGMFEFANAKIPNFQDTKVWKDNKQPEIQHWGKSLNQMCFIMQAFKDLKMHVFFTTLSARVLDDLTKKTFITVKLPGQQSDEIPSVPDIVGYISVVKGKEGLERLLMTQPDGSVDAKDRTEALGVGIKLPNGGKHVTKMLDLIWTKYNIK
jgi:hypothetical protein